MPGPTLPTMISRRSRRSMVVAGAQSISAPNEQVWAVISTPGYVADVHPFCESNAVGRWPGLGSRDTIHYYGGRVVHRDFTAWTEGEGYELDVTDDNGALAHVRWLLEPEGVGRSKLTISIEPRMLDGMPAIVRWAPRRLLVRPMMRRYLRSVLLGVEWRVVNGTPVARNQFGSHPWFSPKVFR